MRPEDEANRGPERPDGGSGGGGRGLRFYRLLLGLFPPSFRHRRQEEMEALFLDMRRGREDRSGLLFWLRLGGDTAGHALREWWALLAGRGRSRTVGDSAASAFLADLRYGVRSLLRRPGWAALIVVTMAVGIAGNAAVFRLFNGLFLRPIPFEDAERLVDLDVRAPRWNLDFVSVAYTDFDHWRSESRSFEAMGAWDDGGANLATDDGAIRLSLIEATHDVSTTLGIEPALGRFFTATEDVPDGPAVALISDGLWERLFARDRSAVGRTIELDGVPHEVIGILPPAADFVADADVWVPLGAVEEGPFFLSAVGRLRPGVTPELAEEELTRLHKARIEERSVNRGTFPVVTSLRARYLGDYRLGGGVLLGAVGIVLLIACANIAALMLARSLDRRREVGVRLAMGAPRRRIVRQLLLESLLLAGLGAVVGAVLGFEGSSLVVDRLAEQLPPWVGFDLDWRFVLFTILVTGGAALLFGLAPALRTSGVAPTAALQRSTGRSTAGPGGRRTMNLLVAGEVALALVLLIAAGLTVRDVQRLQRVETGFRTDDVLTYVIDIPGTRYPGREERLSFAREHRERLEALPGVESATVASLLPLAGHSGWFFHAEGAPPREEGEENPVVLVRTVDEHHFETLGIVVTAGRGLEASDGRDEGSLAAVVNESFVREFLSHRDDPVGARIRTGGDGPWQTVVGVTRDVLHYGPDEEMRPGVFWPLPQQMPSRLQVAVRTAGDPDALVPAVRDVLRRQEPTVAPYRIATMEERLDDALWTRKASAWLIAAFSTVALLLSVAGIYGVVSYAVNRRTHEIGIRRALGADGGRIVREVARQGLAIVSAGVVVGLAVALLASRVLAGMLVDVSASDPVVYGGVTALLATVALLAGVLPARRAVRLDPMRSLNAE